ncbi:MAG: di-heme enzyme [Gammaproteobacteria bacterium]|nr:di-heme enzyme [Gammaproteobacteria bacterium]
MSAVRFTCRSAALFAMLVCGGCGTPDEYAWNIPEGFPEPAVPENNPMTAAKVELGRHLFYDTRLSGNGTQACSRCHQPEFAFTEPRDRAVGSTGDVNRRNTLALVNAAYNDTLMWAHPGITTIEQQVLIPMFGDNPVELGIAGHEAEVLGRFRADPVYQDLFADAFPDNELLEFTHIVDALASFVRSLVSFESPFDAYAYAGQDAALDTAAINGLQHFFSERFECHHCHGGFNFTQSSNHESVAILDNAFHNTGLYNVGDQNAYPREDQGLHDLTGDPGDRGAFRAPTLRNVALTAPYMHDGSLPDLGAVLDFYAAGGRNIEIGEYAGDGRANIYKSQFVQGFDMTPTERAELLAFLQALTDPTFASRAGYQDPFTPDR